MQVHLECCIPDLVTRPCVIGKGSLPSWYLSQPGCCDDRNELNIFYFHSKKDDQDNNNAISSGFSSKSDKNQARTTWLNPSLNNLITVTQLLIQNVTQCNVTQCNVTLSSIQGMYKWVQWNLDYPDLWVLGWIVQTMESLDNWKYEYQLVKNKTK